LSKVTTPLPSSDTTTSVGQAWLLKVARQSSLVRLPLMAETTTVALEFVLAGVTWATNCPFSDKASKGVGGNQESAWAE
jgi:hypothetical protein